MIRSEIKLTNQSIQAIEEALSKGKSAKVTPLKYGVLIKSIEEKTIYEPPKRKNTSRP